MNRYLKRIYCLRFGNICFCWAIVGLVLSGILLILPLAISTAVSFFATIILGIIYFVMVVITFGLMLVVPPDEFLFSSDIGPGASEIAETLTVVYTIIPIIVGITWILLLGILLSSAFYRKTPQGKKLFKKGWILLAIEGVITLGIIIVVCLIGGGSL